MNEISLLEQETQSFELMQRQAQLLASSSLIPKAFQNNVADCVIGLQFAARVKTDAFVILQNMHVIHGKPSFSAQFLIGVINASGRFASIMKFEERGKGDTLEKRAYVTDHDGDKLFGEWVGMPMAKAEGWFSKSGSKWKTMPSLMATYRAAAFFARIYCPDLALGLHTTEENHDIGENKTRNVTKAKSSQSKMNPNELPTFATNEAETKPDPVKTEVVEVEVVKDENEFSVLSVTPLKFKLEGEDKIKFTIKLQDAKANVLELFTIDSKLGQTAYSAYKEGLSVNIEKKEVGKPIPQLTAISIVDGGEA